MDRSPLPNPSHPAPAVLSAEEHAVLEAIRNTSYGAVEIVMHQSRIVQIVKTEKVRVESPTLPV